MKTTAAAELKGLTLFEQVPLEQLTWWVETGELLELLPGQFLFRKGDPSENMYLLLEGQLELSLEQNGQLKSVGVYKKGDITGVLPFSRLTHSAGNAEATEPTLLLALHKRHFLELERNHPELLQVLVSFMTDRVRDFTQKQQLNEKLMALGKLSAGLAHELNNPSAAIVRSSSELLRIHHNVPQKFKRVMMMRLKPEQVDEVVDFTFTKIENCTPCTLGLLERDQLEEELLEWMEERNLEDPYALAEVFVDTNLAVEELDRLDKILEGQYLNEVLEWIASALSTERAICDIQTASQRIFDLVRAVKVYSHMDQGQDKQSVSLQDGIQSTLTMLGHKLREKRIKVTQTFPADLPPVRVFPGEINQVWTNIIDNAIDALPPDGTLDITAWAERHWVKVRIQDNGSGIPAEALSRIFDPFFTTKPVGKGTGLGLDIVRKIIQHHGADISVKSVPGQTEFTVQLPLD
ncbi:ATP-binding protein [Sabulibacter ruber]|uniref:ATP-binding protein n=1 Tax=Sabulibacter ruber TaxID=2811901 RepID=UPI001A957BFD|nr:ATP-binding protein [Sabulibacter ruber]